MKRVLAVCGSPDHWPPGYSLPYEQALRGAGMEPVLIEPGCEIPVDVSGVLLMGGSDVNPARYGEGRHSETDDPDDARDELEDMLIQDAIARNVPLLAICRGIQMLNVQQGGTLVQHIESTARHRVRTTDRGLPAHQVEIVPGTRLATIAGEPPTLDVNSRHHQAIGRLGDGLRVSARDPEDGTIEAVERPDRRFVIGVQWHPENQSATDERQAKLFQAFAAALQPLNH
jgi:gamma-glutamyl-gamma-aminobutyrate hydrolase PuuD